MSHSLTISRPLQRILTASGINPSRLSKSFERRANLGQEMALRPGHPHLVAIRRASGAPVVMVRRRNARLYADLESRSPVWSYRELAGGRAEFVCEGQVSDAVAVALEGRPFCDLASGLTYLGRERVVAVANRNGLVTVSLALRHSLVP